METIESIFKEIDELENKIKTEINLEKLKEIRNEIKKLENPKLEEIIDIKSIKAELWDNLRFASTEMRKESFFKLVEAECESALIDWENKVTLIKNMEEQIKKEIDKLHKLLDETELKLKKLEEEKQKKQKILHSLKQKLLQYNEKHLTSKKYKSFTIVMFLIFSLILASGTAIILNKIGSNSEKTLKLVKNINFEKNFQQSKKITTNKFSQFEENNNIKTNEKSKYEIALEEEHNKNVSKEVKTKKINQQNSFNYKYLIMSLIFLGVGKIISLLYEKMRHPKWMYFVLGPLFVGTVGILMYSFSQLNSFQVSEKEIKNNYEKLLIEINKCKYKDDGEWAASWGDDDLNTQEDDKLACLIISDILNTPVYNSVNDKNKYEEFEKSNIIKNLKKNDELEKSDIDMLALRIMDQYKLYKKYKDDFLKFRKKVNFYNTLAFIMAIVAEILFSSMAWMMLSEKFYGEKIRAMLELDIQKLNKEIQNIDNNIKSNKILIGKIKEKLQELNNYLSEIKSLNEGFYDKVNIEQKKELIKKACFSRAHLILQGVESEIIKKLAKEKE